MRHCSRLVAHIHYSDQTAVDSLAVCGEYRVVILATPFSVMYVHNTQTLHAKVGLAGQYYAALG